MIRTVFGEDHPGPMGGGQSGPRRVRRVGPAQGRLSGDDRLMTAGGGEAGMGWTAQGVIMGWMGRERRRP